MLALVSVVAIVFMGAGFGVLAVFAVIGTIGLLIPRIIYLVAGDRAARLLAELQQWMSDSKAVMAVLFWVIGAKLFGNRLGIVLG